MVLRTDPLEFAIFQMRFSWKHNCDVIKQNELELTNTVFKIQPNKADSFFCFLLFVQSFNCFYFGTNCPISVGFSPN